MLDIIVSELNDMARINTPEGNAANTARQDLNWLGSAVSLPAGLLPDILDVQIILNNGAPLPRPGKHAGESHIIIAWRRQLQRQTTKTCYMLCDDFDARSISVQDHLVPLSVPRFLFELTQLNQLGMSTAKNYINTLQVQGRHRYLHQTEFEMGDLGRLGDP